MKVTVEQLTPWSLALTTALNTVHKKSAGKEPSGKWKRMMLRAEHSPIRCVEYHVRITDLPYWVSVHLTRHKFGIEHFVRTQRTDRTGSDRKKAPQDAPVEHEMKLNAQAFLTISRKRMCLQASPETVQAWRAVVRALKKVDPVLASMCAPDCAYRGYCPEMEPCDLIYSKSLINQRQIIVGEQPRVGGKAISIQGL